LFKHLNKRLDVDASPAEAEEHQLEFHANQLELEIGFDLIEAGDEFCLILGCSEHDVAKFELDSIEIEPHFVEVSTESGNPVRAEASNVAGLQTRK